MVNHSVSVMKIRKGGRVGKLGQVKGVRGRVW